MTIIIKSGGYGLHTDKGGVKLVLRGSMIDVPEDEAKRLASIGVAELVEPAEEAVITASEDDPEAEPGIDPADYAPVVEGDGEAYPDPYTEDGLMTRLIPASPGSMPCGMRPERSRQRRSRTSTRPSNRRSSIGTITTATSFPSGSARERLRA